jgi:hypothetical protein
MRIAVVGGTAGLGFGLALRFAQAGQEVVIGSRQAEKGVIAADRATSVLSAGASVQGGENPDVVKDADAVIVAVPFPGQATVYKSIKEDLAPGIPVIDCTVPLASEFGGKATRVLGVWEGSAAQQARGILNDKLEGISGKTIHVGSGFHTVMARLLERVEEPIDEDVLVCGDAQARKTAEALVGLIPGARFVDCGPLENARILESLAALLVGINIRYKLDPGAGIQITRL